MTKLIEMFVGEKLTDFKEAIVTALDGKRDQKFLEQRDYLADKMFNEQTAEDREVLPFPVSETNTLAEGDSDLTEAHMTPDDARTHLKHLGIDPGENFHSLNSEKVGNLVALSKKLGYRRPRHANGSTGRYFHAHLIRKASKEK
jgi:hypothetical protein